VASPGLRLSFANIKRSRRFWTVVLLLYAITWSGGYIAHRYAIRVDAQTKYDDAHKRELEEAAWYAQTGGTPPNRITRDGGPIVNVNWCFPILPGVLVADSYYIVGPSCGRGGVIIVLFYGVGSLRIGPIGGWIS